MGRGGEGGGERKGGDVRTDIPWEGRGYTQGALSAIRNECLLHGNLFTRAGVEIMVVFLGAAYTMV